MSNLAATVAAESIVTRESRVWSVGSPGRDSCAMLDLSRTVFK